MAKFLTTSDVTTSLEKIIKEAKKRLIIISPYLQINPRIRNLLEDKDREIHSSGESRFSKLKAIIMNEDAQAGMKIRIIYRKGKLNAVDSSWLQDLHSIQTISLRNLHAKCYLNEDSALITSMNLYQTSQVHNYEMGILVTRGNWSDKDNKLYKAIEKHAEELIRYGEKENSIVEAVISSTETLNHSKSVPATPGNSKRSSSRKTKTATPTLERPSSGHCIRCGGPMPGAIESRPFCDKDWRTWDQFKRVDYPEKFCHFCGQPSKTSKTKPLCIDCYRKYQSTLQL